MASLPPTSLGVDERTLEVYCCPLLFDASPLMLIWAAVSWVRKKDLHILTVGKCLYTTDQRFTSIHLENSDDWNLEIRDSRKKDSGIYECQVSTEPKMSLGIQLNIIENLNSTRKLNGLCVNDRKIGETSNGHWFGGDCGSPVVKVSDPGRHVTSSSPVPLKTRHGGQRCTLNLSTDETSSRWCGVVIRRGDASSGVVHVT
ncbi:uncharacterized protein TNCV_3878861 [Trichonephila clavipes]|nr:uncharacterized protein TNCV_3878861 [Trichonephila clavipes]